MRSYIRREQEDHIGKVMQKITIEVRETKVVGWYVVVFGQSDWYISWLTKHGLLVNPEHNRFPRDGRFNSRREAIGAIKRKYGIRHINIFVREYEKSAVKIK